MSYDYSSESNRLDLNNPYIFQNRILFACATALLLTGLYLFFQVQQALRASLIGKSLLLCSIGVGLSMVAVGLFMKAIQRLKFYFGRDKPQSLAADVPIGTTGHSDQAVHLQTILRQRALIYAEPQGVLQNLLYHRFPKLLTAPIWVQQFANQYFSNVCTVFVTFLSFLMAWLFAKDPVTETCVSFIYFLMSIFWLIKPYSKEQKILLKPLHLIILMFTGIVLPILIGLLVKYLPLFLRDFLLNLTFHTQVFLLLICTLVASILLLYAALSQTIDSPVTQVSNELLRLSMNSPPSSIFQEIERILQMQWTDNIPNRCYSRLEPNTPISNFSGDFTGNLLQETQPMPIEGRNQSDTHSVFTDSTRKFLGFTDIFAVLLIGVAILFVYIFIHSFQTVQSGLTMHWVSQNWSILTGAAMMIGVALFCLKNSAYLWGRFDFQSHILWVTVQGSYQTATLGTGNNFSGQMHTTNKFVRVEDMTVNIWRACIESVCFGANNPRQITSMFATQKESKELANSLLDYVNNQSVLTVPESERDKHKMNALFQVENRLKSSIHAINTDNYKELSDYARLSSQTEKIDNQIDNSVDIMPVSSHAGNKHEMSNTDSVFNIKAKSPNHANETGLQFKFCSACGERHVLPAKFCTKCGVAV